MELEIVGVHPVPDAEEPCRLMSLRLRRTPSTSASSACRSLANRPRARCAVLYAGLHRGAGDPLETVCS